MIPSRKWSVRRQGALKHASDGGYYPCLDATGGRPFGLYLRGNVGAERGVTAITTGLTWVKATDYVVVSIPLGGTSVVMSLSDTTASDAS